MSPVLSDLQQLVYLNRGNLCSGLFALQWDCASGQPHSAKNVASQNLLSGIFVGTGEIIWSIPLNVNLLGNTKTQDLKNSQSPPKKTTSTQNRSFCWSFFVGESNLRQWIHWGRPKGQKACPDSVNIRGSRWKKIGEGMEWIEVAK